MEEEYNRRLIDYIYLFLRRKYYFLIITFLVLAIGIPVVSLLPAQYQSSATILIESQQVPTDFIRSTITSYADERIEVIKQKVLVTKKISEIIDKYKLYKIEKEKMTISALANMFRKNVEIKMISANRGRRGQTATIAFSLAFTDKNANIAKVVANELVTLFLSENIKTRTGRAEETTQFLAQEAEKINQKLGEIETGLSDFKLKNRESLPEITSLNLNKMERLETNYQRNLGKIESLKSKIDFLQSELRILSTGTTEDGIAVTSSSAKISALEDKLIELQSVYYDQHPSVVSLNRQIEQLKRPAAADNLELKRLQDEYNNLLSRYSEQHPSVLKKKSELDKMTVKMNTTSLTQTGRSGRIRDPSYLAASAQLSAATSELKQLLGDNALVQKKLNETEQRILKSPEVEKVYKDLLRDYDNMQNKYRDIKNKELEARISQNLEAEKKGERFTLLEPALFPDKPSKPNRSKLYKLVLIAAFGLGIVVVFALEQINPVVRGEGEIESITGELPLIIIPYINSDEDIKKRKLQIILAVILLFILSGLALLAIHLLYTPLDVVWYALMRKIGEF